MTLVENIDLNTLKKMGLNSYKVLLNNFQSKYSLRLIEKKLNNTS